MATYKENKGIAIIGLSCRFPQANSPESFWDLISNGRNVFMKMPEDRKKDHTLNKLSKIRAGFLAHPYLFDNQYFNISDSEALTMDPQQRIMLELAVEAMEDAKYSEWGNQPIGVFVGANQMAYLETISSGWYRQKTVDYLLQSEEFQQIPKELRSNLQEKMESLREIGTLSPNTLIGNLANMISARISHELNLKGPAFSVDTACSSSLVAVHLACESLYRDECDLALAGGVNLNLTPTVFQYMQSAGVISPNGKCIPFSKDSDGILLGEGAGLVALKRLEDALRDQDPIRAVIKGSGINNDGRSLGLMAPAWKGQLALLQKTYSRSGFDPARISAIEAHGTSTRIGDGVELSVIERFFPLNPKQPISVGSVKSNIGHTLGTAGIAGLIKMILSIERGQLPPSLHEEIDPSKKLLEKGIRIQSNLMDWKSKGLRSAGVSSFGFGGTNVHLILEEPEVIPLSRSLPKTVFSRKKFCYEFFPKTESLNKNLATIQWQDKGIWTSEKSYAPKYWLLFAYKKKELKKLNALLTKKGIKSYCSYCLVGKKNTPFVRKDESNFKIDPSNVEHYKWLLDGFSADDKIGVLFLGNDSRKSESPLPFIHNELSAFRYLFRALKQRGNAKVWVVTFAAFQVGRTGRANPQQHALSALAAGTFEEHPELRGALLDLNQSDDNKYETICQALGAISPHPWLIRGKKMFVPELKNLTANEAPVDSLTIKPEGIYLVIGGSSGMGALLVEHIAKQSVEKIVISGTRSPEQLPERLQSLSPHLVDYFQSSAIVKEEVEKLIKKVYEKYGRLNGIIYAAGRISLGSLIKKSQADFEKTVLPKIAGATYLAESLKDYSPDFVFLISSISGLTPSWAGGIVDYAASNAFLDALAVEKSNEDVPWISCSWGLWENTGMSIGLGDHFKGFTQEEGLAIFDTVLGLGKTHVLALPPEQQSSFTTHFSEKKRPKKQQENIVPPVVVHKQGMPSQEPITISKETHGQPFIESLKQYIAEAVELSPEEIKEDASFYELGLDSLNAVDLAQKIEKEIGLTLHPTLLFEYDTVISLSNYVENLDPKKESSKQLTITIDSKNTKRFPLIGAQKTFYAQQQFYPDIPCNMMVNLSVDQRFNHSQMQAAWQKLEEKHDSLRLNFIMTDEGPMQSVLQEKETPIEFRTGNNYSEVLAIENELINHVFDLNESSFLRLVCVEWKQESTTLMLSMHHLIGDAWSMYILLKELLEVYSNITQGEDASLHLPKTPFNDYVLFHNKKNNDKDLTDLKNFWTQNLDNAEWGLPLPYRKPIGKRGQFRMLTGELGISATQNLMQKNQDQRRSIFHTMLAAFFLTLHRETGREDFIIRIANANRDSGYPGIETLTGCLADALPLRIKVRPNADLATVAQNVKRQMLEALKYTGLSSQDIAELPIGRHDSGPIVLSPVGMSFVPMHHLSKDLTPSFSGIRCRTALPFTDISLICFIENEALKSCWNFDEALFEDQNIQRLIDNFLSVLGDNDSTDNIRPPLEMPKEKLFPAIPLLHEKVWEACKQYEQRNAIVSRTDCLSYTAMAQKSKNIANNLIRCLQGDEQIVGILAYPGISAVVGILGILASGRAFIPLDPDWPDGRIDTILTHSKVKTILTSTPFFSRFNTSSQSGKLLERILLIDESASSNRYHQNPKIINLEEISETEISPLPFEITPDSLVYVMYTSGTSGNPKGVMVSHKTVAVFLNWISETFEINEQDRFIHTSSLGFGGSIRQIFSTLLAGATLYPIARTELKDPQSLLSFLDKNQITLLNTVPSVIRNLLEWMEQSAEERLASKRLLQLRYILLGGDSLYAKTIVKWQKYFGEHSRIVNLYGSTETIVNATAFFISPETYNYEGAIPIGYQKKGSLVRLLNEKGELCLPGEVGQIYIGGPCLAEGYYREKELTDQKFVVLDLDGNKGLFYCTGDLAYAEESGLLHFSGRNDDQIQIYGNRVELTEIENTIYQTQHVKNTAVVDLKLEGQHWIAAFVELTKTGLDLTASQIRQFIAQQLPTYMVPHKVILLEQMPLNQAGKIDRNTLRRLLTLELSGQEEKQQQAEEWSNTALVVAEIWKKLLRIKEVKPTDDFFDLGGDSIMALMMLHQLRKHFKVIPKAVSLFKHRTLQELSETIDQLNVESGMEEVRSPNPEVPANTNSLSPSQKGFVLLDKLFPESSPNWAGLLQMQGDFDTLILKRAFDFILLRHPMLRTVFLSEGSKTWQQILDIKEAPVTYSDLCSYSKEEQQSLLHEAMITLQKTDFVLSKYPLFVIQLYKTGENSGVVAICMHHIITDGWSTQILINDLLQAYDDLKNDQEPDLGITPPPYSKLTNYLLKESTGLSGSTLDQHITFWEKTLLDLPAFIPPPEVNNRRNLQTHFMVSEVVKKKLLKWSKVQGVTLYSSILTIFARSLSRLYGLNDPLINTAVSGRDLPIENIQEIVGCFARNLPLRISLGKKVDLSEDVKRVEQSFFGALEHQELPPTELFKIATRLGNSSSVFAINRFYFSFMDFTALDKYSSNYLSLLWDESTFAFSAGGAGSEIMLGVDVSTKIRINLNGYASPTLKERLNAIMIDEIESITGKTDTIDSALIAYLPGSNWLQKMLPKGSSKELVITWKNHLLPNNKPRLLERTHTPYGISGLVFLPFDVDELYSLSPEKRVMELLKGIQIAIEYGAKHISLAGILPSLTNYGFSISSAMKQAGHKYSEVVLSTGHASTVVAVVKTIKKALQLVAVDISQLKVAVVGFGSIGQSSLALLLDVIGQPAELTIADLKTQIPHLDKALSSLKCKYPRLIRICAVNDNDAPAEIYGADLIIGASSSGHILDMKKFSPGTILVDDSFPPAIDIRAGIKRMKEDNDVLFLGGGKLNPGQQQQKLMVKTVPERTLWNIIKRMGNEGMPGCRIEPLVIQNEPDLPPIIGLVNEDIASQYWVAINKMGIDAVELHLADFLIPDELLRTVGQIIHEKLRIIQSK